MRVVPSDARTCCGIESAGVLGIPRGGELALIAPQGACKHAVVLLDLVRVSRVRVRIRVRVRVRVRVRF